MNRKQTGMTTPPSGHMLWVAVMVVTAVALGAGTACSNHRETAGNKPPAAPAAEIPTHVPEPATDEPQEQAAQLDMVRQVIEQGAEVDRVDEEGRTPLMMAAFDGLDQVAALLLEYGAEVNRRDLMGRTALMYAASGPSARTVKVLIDAGAELDAVDHEEHWSALMFAAGEGQTEVVKLLLEHGADRSLADADGETAEDHARARGHEALARLLRAWPNPPS